MKQITRSSAQRRLGANGPPSRREHPARAATAAPGHKRDARPQAGQGPAPIKAKLSAAGFGFAIVVSRFNEFITRRLLESAVEGLERLCAEPGRIEVIEVPGAFEIPAAARQAAGSGRFGAVVCLGLILRGETPHFDFISREVARGVGQSALETGVPHAFGVLTCNTLEEAVQRAGLKGGNKGWEAALAAVEMANLFAELRRELAPPAV